MVAMGVLQRAMRASGLAKRENGRKAFVCLACGSPFEVQYHSCPVCGSYDLRRARWVRSDG